jgi:hypothetical protein
MASASIRQIILGAIAIGAAACAVPAPAPAAQPSPIVVVVTATPGPATPTPAPPTPIVVVVTATPAAAAPVQPSLPVSAAPARAAGAVPVAQVAVAADVRPQLDAIREVATLRTRDLLQRTKNVRAELRMARAKVGKAEPPLGLMQLADLLTSHWVAVGSYGLGTDPYPDRMPTFTGGSLPPTRLPSYGLPTSGSYGLPRLHEAFLEGTDLPAAQRRAWAEEFEALVEPYANPGAFPATLRHTREVMATLFSDPGEAKAYVVSAEYAEELDALDGWYADLETVLGRVPSFFPKPVEKQELT